MGSISRDARQLPPMRWCGHCCVAPGAPGGEGEVEHGDDGQEPDGNIASVRNVVYSRVGRVEKSKHGGTVLFLGKSVLIALLIILLVQFIANQEVCTINYNLKELPSEVQMVLSGVDKQDSWRCPYDETTDVSYTFESTPPTNSSVNDDITMFKVLMADIKPVKRHNSVDTTSRLAQSVTKLCGKRCYIKSCECVKIMITSDSCYLDKYKFGLQLEPSHHDETSHSVFGIYFVISGILLILLIGFYAVFRISTKLWGGKREGIAVLT